MARRVLGVSMSALLIGLSVASARADLITNGDFEASPGFTSWTVNNAGGTITTDAVIAGTQSAIVNKTAGGSYIGQNLTSGASEFQLSAKFSVFAAASNTRTFNMVLFHDPTGVGTPVVNFRVANIGGSQALQAFNGSSWVLIGSLAANATADVNGDKLWTADESLAVNNLLISFHLSSTPGASTYDVTLNGNTVTGVSSFQSNPSTGSNSIIQRLHFLASSSDSSYVVDNVTTDVVPEPATLGLLLIGSALMLRRQ